LMWCITSSADKSCLSTFARGPFSTGSTMMHDWLNEKAAIEGCPTSTHDDSTVSGEPFVWRVLMSFPLFFVCQRECVMLPAFPAAVD
jgi:hypothetical protein